jgi:hypothetical protein
MGGGTPGRTTRIVVVVPVLAFIVMGVTSSATSSAGTFISNLQRAGVHPKTAQALARHSTIGLTMDRYTHVLREQESAALEALPDLSFGPAGVERATGTDGAGVKAPQVNGRAWRSAWRSGADSGECSVDSRGLSPGRATENESCDSDGETAVLAAAAAPGYTSPDRRKGGREAEGDGLLNRYTD